MTSTAHWRSATDCGRGRCAEVVREHLPCSEIDRTAFVEHLRRGSPWREPDVAHLDSADPGEWWGRLAPTLANALIRSAGINIERAHALVPHVRRRFTDPSRWSLYDAVGECLEQLTATGWAHAILSNHVPELARIADALGLSLWIDAIFNSATLGYQTPRPEAIHTVCSAYPDAIDQVMIGDNIAADIRGAEGLGSRQSGSAVRIGRLDASTPICGRFPQL